MRGVKHFLIVFDRVQGRRFREDAFDDASVALRERFVAEKLHRDSPDIEVVVLTAESRDALRVTHSRYFQSLEALATPAKKRTGRKAAATK